MLRIAKPFLVRAGSAQFAFVDPPTALYKYLDKQEYAQGLVERGTVKIGTLYDFRAKEGLDPARGDAGEGQFTITLESAQPETITAENAPWYLKDQVAAMGMPIFSHGGTINAAGNYPDSYVFCTSAVRTPALATAYGPYCVRIHHIVGFFTTLTRSLVEEGMSHPTQLGALGWCQYDGRSTKATSASEMIERPPVPFTKVPEKADELEIRAVWYPAQPDPTPRIVTCPELTAFCSRVQ